MSPPFTTGAGTGGPRWRSALANLALLLASCVLVLGALEVAFRVDRERRGGGKERQEERVYVEYDPLLGWRKIPGARVTYDRREYRVDLAINSLGLRDPERGHQAPADVVRLLALGDSFLEGYTVPLAQTLTQVLERRLAAEGCRAEVINAGTTAYSTDQEYLFYRSEGKHYSPQVVVVFFYYNDVVYNDRQWYSGRPKPVFQIAEGGLELHRYPVLRLKPTRPPVPAEDETVAGSALAEWLEERLWMGAPRVYNLLARSGLWEPIAPQPIRLELRVFSTIPVAEVEDAWAKTAAVFRALAREVVQDGGRLLVAYVPSRMEVQDDSWRLSEILYGFEERRWDRTLVAARLQRLGQQDGYPVLDLTAALRRADRGLLGRPYFAHDGHWTAIGHSAVAREIHEKLVDLGWLSTCRRGAPRRGKGGAG